MITRTLRGLATLATAVSLSSAALAGTITLTDTLDRRVEVPDNARRILLGFYFEDFFAVGGRDAYDRVVAISRETWRGWRGLQWKAYVRAVPHIAELADVGEAESGTFSLESAISVKPDLAILAAWQAHVLGDQVKRLEAAGVPVVVLDYNAQTVEKHVTSTLALGAVLGQPARARELADLYAKAVRDVTTRVSGARARPKVYVELARKGAGEIDNSYGDTMWGRLVEAAGGTNIAKGQIAKWGPLNPEYVLAENPEAIFLAGSGWLSRDKAVLMGPGVVPGTSHERMRPYVGRPGWSRLRAVVGGQVHAIYHGGARTLYDFAFLQYMAKALHPELFEDVDPQANLDAFFAKYMPIRFNGTYMTKLP
ncbi:MAG: ABC transporter substrate-binding protein [Alphaproteobacteria bacterium]|jgi:ABC-type Fe3+-hydroxamate transport system substrate-binding protein|nr:ABC transporter substrate-binding protein [Alphaproteobacteria bacterium]